MVVLYFKLFRFISVFAFFVSVLYFFAESDTASPNPIGPAAFNVNINMREASVRMAALRPGSYLCTTSEPYDDKDYKTSSDRAPNGSGGLAVLFS